MRFGEREDIGLGALVCLLGIVVLGYFHGRDTEPESDGTYPLYAHFHRTDGLTEGAPIRLAGITVGVVGNMSLSEGFQARATLQLQNDVRVPSDSAAVIHTDGLFGAKYIEIEPGGAMENLASGDRIAFTQDALIVDDLLERMVAMAKTRNAQCNEALAAPPATPPAYAPGLSAPSPLLPINKGP